MKLSTELKKLGDFTTTIRVLPIVGLTSVIRPDMALRADSALGYSSIVPVIFLQLTWRPRGHFSDQPNRQTLDLLC